MKELLEFLIKGIVPGEDVSIEEEIEGDNHLFSIKVSPESTGLLIGKAGKTIKAIRNIVKVRATLEKAGVSINIKN